MLNPIEKFKRSILHLNRSLPITEYIGTFWIQITVYQEPVDGPDSFRQLGNTSANPLRDYYENKHKHAYTFQKYVLRLYKQKYERFSKLSKRTIVIFDHSLDSTSLFTSLNRKFLSQEQFTDCQSDYQDIVRTKILFSFHRQFTQYLQPWSLALSNY